MPHEQENVFLGNTQECRRVALLAGALEAPRLLSCVTERYHSHSPEGNDSQFFFKCLVQIELARNGW